MKASWWGERDPCQKERLTVQGWTPQSRQIQKEKKKHSSSAGEGNVEWTRGKRRYVQQRLCHIRGVTHSHAVECFQFSVLRTACCMSSIMLEPAFRAVTGSHTGCVLYGLTLRTSPMKAFIITPLMSYKCD